MTQSLRRQVTSQVWLEAVPNNTTLAELDGHIKEGKGLLDTLFLLVFRVTETSRIEIGHTSFSPLPGCCGIVVSHGTYLTEQTRGSGLSEPFRKLKEQIARELGYSLMLATTDMANFPAVGNMFRSNYQMVDAFTNKRTGHLIGLGIKKLTN